METKSVAELVRLAEQQDKLGNSTLSKYVTFNMRENIDKIDAYVNSKHTSGPVDAMGRDKPFFNIVTAAINIWYRATDVDRKNVRIKATKQVHIILAFVATILLQEWMNRASFGVFLNKWGRTLAKYGSAILKFVVKEDGLHADVMNWNTMIVDPINFNNNIKIEKMWLTPAQLKKRKGYNKELVNRLINDTQTRKLLGSNQKQDNNAGFIPIYEVHGDLPLCLITGDERDEETYTEQMHVISFLEKKEKNARGEKEYDEYTLISGNMDDPYMITHLLEEENRTMAIGAVENLFESQWMVNHNAKNIKDQLDITSKIIFQTADDNFVGQNALSAIESGDILVHGINKPVTSVAMGGTNITGSQAFLQAWQAIGNQINGISESMMGVNPPSGTAWRQTEALLQESKSLFELMTESKRLAIEEMMRRFIIPYIKTKMNNSDEISSVLADQHITKLDSMYIPNEAIRRVNGKFKEMTLAGEEYGPEQQQMDIQAETAGIKSALDQLGNQRFIRPSDIPDVTWEEALKGFEWEVEVDTGNENKDVQAVMDTLNTAMKIISSNKDAMNDPNFKMIFNKILTEVGGLSPVEFKSSEQPVQTPNPSATPTEMPSVDQMAGATAMVGGPAATA